MIGLHDISPFTLIYMQILRENFDRKMSVV